MKKRISALALATAMTASLVTPAMAATTYDYIEDIDLKVSYSIEAGMTDEDWSVSVDLLNHKSIIQFDEDEDVTVSYAPDEGETWKEGVKPKITIVMKVDYKEDGWKFDDDKIEADGGVTVTTDDDLTISKVNASSSKVTVTLTLPKLKYPEDYWDTRLDIEDAEWGDDGVATWAENENVEGYEVRVYRGTKSLATGLKTTDTEMDLSKYFTSKGEYTFKVRGYYDDYKGEWEESDDLDLDKEEAEEIFANSGNTSSSSSSSSTSTSTVKPSASTANLPSYVVKGNWGTKNGKWTFTDSKGVAYKNKWAAVYNPYANTAAGQQAFDWFYFDANGEMVTGWILDGGRYYYCSPKSDGTQGRMVTEWNQIDGFWYYFNPKSDGTRGAMLVNTWIGNDYVGADGKFEKSR